MAGTWTKTIPAKRQTGDKVAIAPEWDKLLDVVTEIENTLTGPDLTGTTRGILSAVLRQGTNVSITVDDNAGTVTLAVTGLAPVATSGAYGDLTGRPILATVATSGAFSDLSGTPALSTVATSGAYTDLSGTPALSAVATSGSYTDLANQPTLYTGTDAVKLTGNQTVAGVKTFSTLPVLPSGNPTTSTQAAHKGYADSLQLVTVNAQTAAYTLVLADAGKAIEVTSASALNVTVPTNATVAFPVGTIIEVAQFGTAAVTLAPAAGVTLQSAGTLVTRAQYSALTLRKRATDTWHVTGDTA